MIVTILILERTENVAADLKHLLERMFPVGFDVKFVGQYTDNGGGRAKYALYKALVVQNLLFDFYLIATCSLHNLQMIPHNVVVTVMGEG